MSKERQGELEKVLQQAGELLPKAALLELLHLRREEHRDFLENEDNGKKRGRALECKDLRKILTAKNG